MARNNFIIFMLSLRTYFRRAKRVSNPAPFSRPFDVDEFVELVVRKQARKTTVKENKYVRWQVENNPKAAQVWEDAKETSPHERFSLRVYYFPLARMVAVFVVAILIVMGIYAFTRYYNVSVSIHVEKKLNQQTHFVNKQLDEVANLIEDTYSRKVIFDRAELRSRLLSARINPSMQLSDFLDELRYNNVDTYIDSMGYIHIR